MAKKSVLVNNSDMDGLKKNVLRTLIDLIEEKPPLGISYEKRLRDLIDEAFFDQKVTLENEDKSRFLEEIYKYATTFKMIDPMLADPEVSEIMINGPDNVYKEALGKILSTDVKFDNDMQVMFLINHIINPLGRYISYKIPMVDAHLPDGSRVNAVVPPIIKQGPVISIRKFIKKIMNLDELLELGAINENMAEFLKICVRARLNILVGGNTSAGKTTLLNILAGSIPENERIITLEDSLELQLPQPHILSLEARPADNNGEGMVSMRDLVRNVLRMRPDRIIVGEVRGSWALDMLQAMNTGHDGSMTTVHSNSARDTLSRLETMVMTAGLDIPIVAIRRQMASALDLIVYLTRFPDGTRKVTQITEVVGMETDVISLTDLFLFQQTDINDKGQPIGTFRSTGLRPMFDKKVKDVGLLIPPRLLH